MLPEDDFETWKLVVTTVTDDIASFGEVLPDLSRLMNSISETNSLPDELHVHTDDFLDDTFPCIVNSLLKMVSPMIIQEDNTNESQIISDFFRLAIKLCTSKINIKFAQMQSENENILQIYKKMSICSTKMLQMLSDIFDTIDLKRKPNEKEKFINQNLIYYFLEDLKGVTESYLAIDNINHFIDEQKANFTDETNDKDLKSSTKNDLNEIIEKESTRLSIIFKLIQKVVYATTFKTYDDSTEDEIGVEMSKMIEYSDQMHMLLEKALPTFQKIAECNLRQFDTASLAPVIETIAKSFQIDLKISKDDEFPFILNLLEPSYAQIFTLFLKSQFFDKHFYTLKNLSTLCSKVDDNYQNNKDYFESNQKNLHLRAFFVTKDALLSVIVANLELIKNLHFNKEFGEPIGIIYTFVIQNSDNCITIDYIKTFWCSIQFVFAADQDSFYKIFEKIIKVLNPTNCEDLVHFIMQHISKVQKDANSSNPLTLNTAFLDFLYNIARSMKKEEFKVPFLLIRNLFWSMSFKEISTNDEAKIKEESEMKDFARRKLPLLCDIESSHIIEKIVKKRLPIIQKMQDDHINSENIERENKFIIQLLQNSFNSNEKISAGLCNQILPICISNLTNNSSIDLLTKICTTQEITLEKEQIKKLSNVSNKFLKSIVFSSKFNDDDIEKFFLSTKNIDSDLVEMINKYIFDKNKQFKPNLCDYLTHLPFDKEDLLWKFSLMQSNVQHKFIKLLCQIYSNNDGELLTDKQMINTFLNRIEKEIDTKENRNSCYMLLKKFLKVVDRTNPKLAEISKHKKSEENLIPITFEGSNRKFLFSDKNISLVVYYQASKLLNVPINMLKLIYSASPLPLTQKLSIFSRLRSIKLDPFITNEPNQVIINHIRTASPLIEIRHSNLIKKLISLMFEKEENDKDDLDLAELLNDLPTFEPVFVKLSHFNIMKEIDFERIFPIRHPMIFLYSLQTLETMDENIKKEFIRARGIEYLTYALTNVDSKILINEIISYLKLILTQKELIEEHSNQLFEALIRIYISTTDFDQDSCLTLMKKLKPTSIPSFQPGFSISYFEPESNNDDEENEKYEQNCMRRMFEYEGFPSELYQMYNMSPDIQTDMLYLNSFKHNKDHKKKEDKIVHIDNKFPLSHAISACLAISFIKKNICFDESLKLETKNSSNIKQMVKETFSNFPIPSEYFEFFFSYLTPSNTKDFMNIYLPHAKPPTETAIQFILNNLDIKSNYLCFILDYLELNIDEIKDEEQRKIIFDFIYTNLFTLQRDPSIDNECYKDAIMIASSAPTEQIINGINKVGIPTFERYNIDVKDFAQSKSPTGLKNLGFTCYFNSILQQFYHCLSLRKALIEYNGKDQLLKELGSLFSQMKNGSLKYVTPQKVIDNWFCWDGDKLNPKIQQDAAEYTIMMVDKLAPIIPNSMFNGKLLFKIEGINNDEGQFYSERQEPFSVLILSINQSNSIEDCIKSFSFPSYFTSKNQYYADTLKRKIDAKQSDFIYELPDHLILQLKRFEYDYSEGTRKKINSVVKISSEIDVSSICDFKELNEKRNTKYKLTGIIQHMGSAMGGHYYSFVMDRETQMWYKFNDTEVTIVTLDEVISSANRHESNAYILFYDKDGLVEVDDSTIDSKSSADLENEKKMNHYYNFYLTEAFTQFLSQISKRKDLQELAVKLILKIVPHETDDIPNKYFEILKSRLQNDLEFALLMQEEINDFKFLVLNKSSATNYFIHENILCPMFSKSVPERLIQLNIDIFDFVVDNLPSSFSYFRNLYDIVKTSIKEKAELLKDEENNKEKIEFLTKSLNTIYEKVTYVMKDGIKDYIKKHPELTPLYITESINTSVIVRIFNITEYMPDEYVQLLKDEEFLKSFYSSNDPTVHCLMKNYIRARELNLFDVNSFLESFFIKESNNISTDLLFDSIIIILRQDSFKFCSNLKIKKFDYHVQGKEIVLCYALACKEDYVQDIFYDCIDDWFPVLLMHDARAFNTPSQMFFNEYHDDKLFSTINLFDSNAERLFGNRDKIIKMIKCALRCFKELKELISKDDYSKSASSSLHIYRGLYVIKLFKSLLKVYKFHFGTDIYDSVDFSELVDLGEFLVTTGHSHPFDPQIVGILKILKTQCSERLLIESIPSKDIMMSKEKIQKMSSIQFEKYLKIITKIMDQKMKNGFSFSEDFYDKLFMMIVFNLSNLSSLTTSIILYNSLKAMIELICDKNKESSQIFIRYIDSNFQFCFTNGFTSCITGLSYLNIQRPFTQYTQFPQFSNLVEQISITSPNFMCDIISSNENKDNETLFNDISIIAQFIQTKENDDKCNETVWNYLINNTKKRINECDNNEKLADLRKKLFYQFTKNFDFDLCLNGENKQKQKEIKFITEFLIQFIPQSQSDDELEKPVFDLLIFISKNSFNALSELFEYLIQKVPEKLKESEFVSDALSNEIGSENWAIVEKLCNLAFEGKKKEEIISILQRSRIIPRLIQELDVLNFIYEKGIIENKFKFEDEKRLSSLVVPFKLMVKYENYFNDFINDDDKVRIKKDSSSFLHVLKKCEINCHSKEDVITTIVQFIS